MVNDADPPNNHIGLNGSAHIYIYISKSAARQSATVPTLISGEATRLLQEQFMDTAAGTGDTSRTKILKYYHEVAGMPCDDLHVISM